MATTTTLSVYDEFSKFLDEHTELIQYRRWHYLEQIQKLFNEECKIFRSTDWIKKHLHIYRLAKSKPTEYCENKHYISPRKTAMLGLKPSPNS